jgi:hypothetical protein
MVSLAGRVKSRTLKLYLTGLKSYHIDLGLDTSAFDDERLERTIRGIKREHPDAPRRERTPLIRPKLLRIFVGEAAHALSNRAGTKLTLLTAVTVGEKVDTAMLEAIELISFRGIRARYKGKTEMQRFEANQKRWENRREKAQQKAQAAAEERDQDIDELLHAAINFNIEEAGHALLGKI